jgi:Spy/CpxP family protein refolding chaperone
MHSRRWIVGLAAICGFLATSLAGGQRQQPSPEELKERLTKQLQEMAERLKLSEEQKEQIRAILEAQVKEMQELREKTMSEGRSQSSMSQMREGMQKIQKDTDANLEEILTAEQMAEYKKIRQEQQEERRKRMRDRRPGR